MITQSLSLARKTKSSLRGKMPLEISGVEELREQLRRISDFLKSENPMRLVCLDVAERILHRTESGRDYKNRKFAPYSIKYAKRKKVGISDVTLRLSGTMLGAIEIRVVGPLHGQVLVMAKSMPGGTSARSNMIAQIHTTGTGKQPKREFMNITPTALQQFVKKYYDDEIMRILGRF